MRAPLKCSKTHVYIHLDPYDEIERKRIVPMTCKVVFRVKSNSPNGFVSNLLTIFSVYSEFFLKQKIRFRLVDLKLCSFLELIQKNILGVRLEYCLGKDLRY